MELIFDSFFLGINRDMTFNKLTEDIMRDLLKDPRGGQEVIPPKYLYHASRERFKDSILKEGLLPKRDNVQDSYSDPRVYLTLVEVDAFKIAHQLKKALRHYAGNKEKENYIIFRVDTSSLNFPFFYRDPYFYGGVYTLEAIPVSNVKMVNKISWEAFSTLKKWKEFWDWVIWNKKQPEWAWETRKP